jgi:F0F1-type ATP synthase delta subunit
MSAHDGGRRTRVSERYAQALLSLAETEREADATGDMLAQFAQLMGGSAELREFLLNPLVAASLRKDVAMRAISGAGRAQPDCGTTVRGADPTSMRGGGPTAHDGALTALGGEPAALDGGTAARHGALLRPAGGEQGTAPDSGADPTEPAAQCVVPVAPANSADPPAQPDCGTPMCGGGPDGALAKFLCLLIDKNRLPEIFGIAEDYSLLKSAARNELRATVYSRRPLERGQLDALSRKYARQSGAASVLIENIVDESVLGGLIAQIGDVRVDSSLSGRLAALGRAIAR